MKFSFIVPHYKTGRVTAYCLYKLLKHRGNHDIQIIVVDNSSDDSIKYLLPFTNYMYKEKISGDVIHHSPEGMQSHGIAVDEAVPHVSSDYFIVVESDSYPTRDGWLDGYQRLVELGTDAAGSLLSLSGGKYLHPAGALYSKKAYLEALTYTSNIRYTYFPNMAMKEGFPCHLMVKRDSVIAFLAQPAKWGVELSNSYLQYSTKEMLSMEDMLNKARGYSPVTKVFHNGMGRHQEAFSTYRFRDSITGREDVMLDNKDEIIYRMGYEPGQWFYYWLVANQKTIVPIPTQTSWLPNRVNQQQEFTEMTNGFRHLWGVTAYSDVSQEELRDITENKRAVAEANYQSLPEEFKYRP